MSMNIEYAIKILKQQRDYWSYDLPDGVDKRPPAVLRRDLVAAMDLAISIMKKEDSHE